MWAGRKIAYLIDQVRRHGESDEMIKEILELSQAYGIQTPYSSWLVDPERTRVVTGRRLGIEPLSARRPPAPGSGAAGRAGSPLTPDVLRDRLHAAGARGRDVEGALAEAPALAGELQLGDEAGTLDLFLAGQSVTADSGEAANIIARTNAKLRALRSVDDDRLDRRTLAWREIDGRWYHRMGRFLVEESIDEDTKLLLVRFASDAYFELVRARPDLRAALSASANAVVRCTDAQAVLVSDRVGVEQFSDEDRQHLRLTVR